MSNYKSGSLKYLIEAPNGTVANATEGFIRQATTTGRPPLDRLTGACVALALFDERNRLVRTVIYGSPSEEMRRRMAIEFGSEPDSKPVAS